MHMWRYNAPMRTLLLVCLAGLSPLLSSITSGQAVKASEEQGETKQSKQHQADDAKALSKTAAGEPENHQAAEQTHAGEPYRWNKVYAPETWSNWAVVLVGIAAGLMAYRSLGIIGRQTEAAVRAAELAENALHLTERADILVAGVPISTHPEFNGESVIAIVFKNFGRTRGNRVETNVRLLYVPEIELLNGGPRPTLAAVLGAGDTLTSTFQPMRKCLNKATFGRIIGEDLVLRFEAEVVYFDVFDKRHRTKCSGTFMPNNCSFRIDANQEAD